MKAEDFTVMMNKLFYPRLAADNIKKNSKTYVPYILTCICTVMMFYNMCMLSFDPGLSEMKGSEALMTVMSLGTIIVAIFSVVFMFYTNSFLVKRRKKEFGLFNILGMEKKHLSKVLALETLYVAFLSLTFGIGGGVLLSKLMYLGLFKLLGFSTSFGFSISKISITYTLILFAAVFILILLFNMFQIHVSKPVELLRGGQVGEKEPKTKWLLVIIGVLSLGTGYYIAITTENPLQALMLFFVAVILVIVGTYCLFTAGSIAILKLLRRNKNYYYKTKHFTAVSSMMYRMKQNAAGLANICILSTMVLVMVSSTLCLYLGMEDSLVKRYPRDVALTAQNVSENDVEILNKVVKEQCEKFGADQIDVSKYRYASVMFEQKGNSSFCTTESYNMNNIAAMLFVPLSDYNEFSGESKTLEPGECFLYIGRGKIDSDTLDIDGEEFRVKENLSEFVEQGMLNAMMYDSYYIVVDDVETALRIYEKYLISIDEVREVNDISYSYSFNTSFGKERQGDLVRSISSECRSAIKATHDGRAYSIAVEGPESYREDFLVLFGGLFFLGLFLGFLFMMATVLIIYYKQISEGYDDKDRYDIMQKVGMTRAEVRKSIKSQVLTVFFLPLVAAGIHLAFSFKLITRLFSVLSLMNTTLFALCMVGAFILFAVFYAIVYAFTARVYYKIVEKKIN